MPCPVTIPTSAANIRTHKVRHLCSELVIHHAELIEILVLQEFNPRPQLFGLIEAI